VEPIRELASVLLKNSELIGASGLEENHTFRIGATTLGRNN
jgi:hypothetical protein